MNGKVMLMLFGVIIVLTAVFFFFKSFASHEQRMQEEQRQRIEMEREKLAAEQATAGRPLSPEERAQRERLKEARRKAQEARRKAAEIVRKEAEQERLKAKIEAAKKHAEEEQRRQAEIKAAEDARKREEAQRTAEAKKLAAAQLEADRAKLLATCKEVLDSTERTTRAVKVALANSEDAVRNEETQRKAAKTRIMVMTRQLEAKQRLVDSIPVKNQYVCPALTCGRYRPRSTASTTGSGLRCPYCKTGLVLKDTNEKRRRAALEDLNKTRQMLALEQQRAAGIQAGQGNGDVATYKMHITTLQQLKDSMALVEQKLAGEAPNVPTLMQELARAKTAVDGIMRSLPPDLSRIATAAPAPKPPAPKNKVYKLKDGRTLEVTSVMMAGDDVILKTTAGEMVTVKKADIESSGKAGK